MGEHLRAKLPSGVWSGVILTKESPEICRPGVGSSSLTMFLAKGGRKNALAPLVFEELCICNGLSPLNGRPLEE
jgi:hypothetical protein